MLLANSPCNAQGPYVMITYHTAINSKPGTDRMCIQWEMEE